MRSQGKPLSPNLETKTQILTISTHLGRNLCGNQCLRRKIWTVTDKLLDIQCRHVCDLNTPRGMESERNPNTFLSFTSKNSTRSSPFWNMPEHSVLGKACLWERLFCQSLTCLGEGETWETLVRFTVQGQKFTKRRRPNYRTIECFPYHHTTTPVEVYLPQFLLPRTSCPPFNRKLQGTVKGKRTKFEKTKQALEPEVDMAGMLELSNQEFF